ncbi:lytic polysaccharide monooxygenase [Streptomyces sp. NPDC057445]|uniref:lytic polysaccharide monooxygenase auxiliary activity family 9 protein n=1 Tax=Streptomyces sp. NPDC057445 TaxID=3346136 RepID=UPI003698CE16
MSSRRTIVATVALVGSAPLLLLGVCAGPAVAHGAPSDPVSRAVACGPQGGHAQSAACVAAVRRGGREAFEKWDNLRVADVAGRDRRMIPDGKLCSAGIDTYKGLDIARADWPADTFEAGAPFALTYASTIPHRGTFSVYLTKDGYDPNSPLAWDDLDGKPFLTATDPVFRDGAYRIEGKLPAGRAGRHLLYTIWRNTDTPDTYYSCSDVVLTAAGSDRGDAGAVTDQKPENGGKAAPGNHRPTEPEGEPEKPPAVAARTPEKQPPPAPVVSQPEAAAKPASATANSGGLTIAWASAAVLAVVGAAGGYLRHRRRSH